MCGIICSLNELTPRQLTLSGVYFILLSVCFHFNIDLRGRVSWRKDPYQIYFIGVSQR